MIKPNKCINCRVLIIKGSADKLDYRHLLSCVSYDVRENCQLYYQIQQCESISEIYGEEASDCILLDWELCDRQAEKFLQQLSQDSVPIVILAETKNQSLFTHIAQDVLIKETLTPEFLDFAVQQAIAKAQLKKQLAEAERVSYEHRQSEINLQAFLNNAPAIIFTKDLAGRYLSINHEFEVKLQTSFAQICGKTDLDFLPPEIANALRQNDQRAISEKRAIHVEETVELEDGLHTYIATKFPLLDEQGELFGMAGISIDISDRIAIENSLKVQNRVLEKIAKGEALSDILDLLVRGIESQLQQVFCSIMICDRQGRLFCLSAPNLPETFRNLCNDIPIAEGVGSCGTAAFRKQTVIVADIATDPLWQDFKQLALDHGLKACWSVPIASSDGSILGTFGVYRRKISAPQPQELEVITLAANIAGIALERERTVQDLHQLTQELEDRVEQRTIALQKSENRYRALMDGASDGILQADIHGNLIECNRQAEKLFGYSRDQLLQLHMSQIHSTEVLAEAFAHFSAVKAGRDTSVLTSLVVRNDGSHVPVDITGSLIEINGESIAQGIFRDISDRKQTEEALKQSELKLRKLTENIPVALYQFLLKTDGSISFPFMSQGSFALYGVAPEVIEADVNAMFDLIHPEDLPSLNQSIELSAQTLKTWKWEGRIYTILGEIKWTSGISQPELLENGDILWHGMIRDISDRKKAELENQALKERLEFVISSSPAITYAFKIDGKNAKTTFISENIKFILGYTSQEFLADPNFWNTHVHPDNAPKVFAEIPNLFNNGINTVEYRFLHQDGTYRWLQDQAQVIRDQAGIPIEFVGSLTDISDRKKLEQEQMRLIAILEATPDYIGMVNAQGEILWHNKQLRTLRPELGSPDLHRTISDCHPDWANKIIVEQALPKAIQDGSWSGELALLDGIGGEIPVSQVIIVHKSADGTVENFSTIMRNISDRKKAELELQNSQKNLKHNEELLRLTIENTPVGIATFDLEANFLTANQDMCQIFGYSRNELLQQNMLSLTHPDFVELSKAGIAQLTAGTEKNIRLEKQYIHKSGKIIDAICRVSLVKDAEENPLHFVATVEDITEQKAIAIAKKQQMDRQEFLMNITQQIRQSLNLEQVLETAVTEVKRLINCDRAIIFQLFDDGETQIVKEAVEPNYPSILNRKWHDEHFTNEGFEFYINANVRIVPEVSNDKWTSRSLEFMQEAQVKSKIAVPIIQHINPQVSSQADQETPQIHRWCKGNSQLWGLLIVHSCEKIRQWQSEEVELLQQLANQLAIAIQQANLYKQVQDELLENKRLNLIVNNELVQKKVLLREIHHRVKNNLQVMSSILYLQFRHTPPEIKLLSEEYQNRIYSMALIHDQLHREDNLSQINFDIYITNLATNLFECYGTNRDIQLEVNVNDIFLSLDLSISLGLIINELISNALKYAFPDLCGKIRIQLFSTAESLILTVSDNGVGIPDSFDLKNAKSTGMQLVQSLTEQLEGEFNYYVENGSTFQITVPLP